MREIRLYGSEGGGAVCSPYPYPGGAGAPAHAICSSPLRVGEGDLSDSGRGGRANVGTL